LEHPHRHRDRPQPRQERSRASRLRALSGPVDLGAGWIKTDEQSGKDYISLGLAAPEFGPRRLYVNLGRAAGQDDDDVFALTWNPAD
jgi:uncharacterized protein (DUF736 family)